MGLRRVSLIALLACLPLSAPCIAAEESNNESIIFFKNGRALRVAGFRVDGDWAYLTVSQRADPEEEPSEIVVRRDSIARLTEDTAAEKALGGVSSHRRGGRTANGRVPKLTPSGLPFAEVRGSGGGSIPHVPDMDSAEARMYKPRSSSPDIDMAKAGAGHIFYEPLRHLKVPQRYKNAARQYKERQMRQQELDRQAALEGKTAASIMPPIRLPRGYTMPPGWVNPNPPPPTDDVAPHVAGEPDGPGS